MDICDGNYFRQLIITLLGDDFGEDEDFIIENEGKNMCRMGTSLILTDIGDNKEDNEFDRIVGALQEILLDDNFERLQKKFCNEFCMHFEATEENKLIYTDIFKKYHDTIEAYIQ
jgi:ADP-ribosylation factor 2-binding protein